MSTSMTQAFNSVSTPSSSASSGSASNSNSIGGMSLLNWLTNIGFGFYDRINQKKIQNQNQSNFQSQFDYQKSLNQALMDREDNQFQRTVADMRAAGLNPLSINGASTNNLSSSMGTSGNSAVSHAFNSSVNPVQDAQNAYINAQRINQEVLNGASSRSLQRAQSDDLISQARMRDVQTQLLESTLPESDFKRGYFESFDDETKSRYYNAKKDSEFQSFKKSELENISLRESNKSTALNNEFVENTMQARIYQVGAQSTKIREEIEDLRSKKNLNNAEIRKRNQEISNLEYEAKRLDVEIKRLGTQANILGLDLDTKLKTHEGYIEALKRMNKKAGTLSWDGSYSWSGPFGLGVSASNNYHPSDK